MKKKGFTLIELLVVIAIIAILLAVLMPSLKKAKKIAQIAVCVSNCDGLGTAWATYAADNNERIVSSMTGYSTYANQLQMTPVMCENPWVGWAGYPNYNNPADKKRQIQAVEQGVLFPYIKSIDAYRCPASRKDQVRCYAIPDNLGNLRFEGNAALGDQKIMTKTTDIKLTSDQIVFLDEDDISYGGFTIWQNQPKWWDNPPSRHNGGVTLGYADGHANYYKWREKETHELTRKIRENPGSVTDADRTQPGNQDLIMMQRGIYGTIGYTP